MNHLSINWSVSHHHFSHLISIALERKKSKHLLLCFLFCLSFSQLLLSSCFSFSNSTKICPHGQSLTLLQLKKSFSFKNSYSDYFELFQLPSYPKTDYWNEGSDCCSWEWVSCDLVTGHVIELDLVAVGSLEPSIPILPSSAFLISKGLTLLSTISVGPLFQLGLVGSPA